MSSKTAKKATIFQAGEDFLETVRLARSPHTARTYANALNKFYEVLDSKDLPHRSASVGELTEDAIAWFASALKNYSPATESLYLTVGARFYEYLAAERLSSPNLPRLRLLIRQRARRPGQRLPQFPKNDIEIVTDYVNNLTYSSAESANERLRVLRDRSFLLTLCDTGLRVQEACSLRRGDLDWNEQKAIITGKGNRQAVVRFSNRSIAALRTYLNARALLDGASGRPLASLPLFARHDKGAGKKIKPITTATGRNIVKQRVVEALEKPSSGSITPHSFRHYFVTRILVASGGNLKLAQELARHRNIAVTQRYAHLSDDELDRGYYNAFEN